MGIDGKLSALWKVLKITNRKGDKNSDGYHNFVPNLLVREFLGTYLFCTNMERILIQKLWENIFLLSSSIFYRNAQK